MLTVWVTYNIGNFGFLPCANLTPQAFNEVKTASPKLPPPALISKTVIPEIAPCKWGEGLRSVSDEAAGGMCIET